MGSEHWVVCKVCGKKFDVSNKGGFYDGSRYICKSCGKKINASINGEKESWFKKYWKLLFGVIFLIGGVGNIGKSGWDTVLISLFIAIGLLLWHFFPAIKEKRDEKTQQEAIMKAENEKVSTCSKCGAKVVGKVCEYCGSVIEK